jgi:hypothetical protein
MRIFRFWTKVEATVDIEGQPRTIRCFGGSNVSEDDARRDAGERLGRIRERIAGRAPSKGEYEADIREETVDRIDDRNVITRNRYGATVLNSADVLFADIDEPRYRFWEVLFSLGSTAKKKELIVAMVRRQAARPEFSTLGIRLYETHKGVRAIITGRRFDPKSPETAKLLRRLNADGLYTTLCRKQGCFRARLTPKPHRMRCSSHRVVFPRESAEDEAGFQAWLAEYEAKRTAFSTCRFLCTVGRDVRNPIVDYHDRVTGAQGSLKLA